MNESIKTVVPHVQIVIGGLASGNAEYLVQVKQAAGGLLPCDGVGIHPYGRRPSQNWPSPTWGFGTLDDLLNMYSIALGTKIQNWWITEWGTDDLNSQGDFPYNAFIAAQQSNVVVNLLWFCWSDGMVSPFGLVTAAQQPKPSYWSYKKFTAAESLE
eukprot:TRINITY_DN6323_c0_g1_i3.p1 TRINITY_DN6323_c0_g1~~TRINITY_DN6323_c0_g1_i3.p1  ORF type:complete len:157 (-),score=35.70 TRINITY_DN6323_c0_g1_i3:112-582(-)